MIEMLNVSRGFDRFNAVENVNLSIHKGSIYGLIGANGAGKTTLIKLLAGIYLQDEGSVGKSIPSLKGGRGKPHSSWLYQHNLIC